MNDEDERVTEFVKILSNAVERETEIKSLQVQRDELLEALEWYAKKVEDLNKGGWTAGKALGVLQGDRGRRAKEAIAKAKGERRVLPSPQGPDSFTTEAARAVIKKAKGD